MAGRALLAWVLGTLALIGWGMLFFLFIAGPIGMFHALPGSKYVTDQLVGDKTATGTYFVPWPRSTEAEQRNFVDSHKAGGFYRLSYVAEGVDPGSTEKMLWGAGHLATVALLAVMLLAIVQAPNFLMRAVAVVLAGGMGTVLITVGDPIWFHLPWDYCVGAAVYQGVSWLLLGLIAGGLMKTGAEMATSTPAPEAGDSE